MQWIEHSREEVRTALGTFVVQSYPVTRNQYGYRVLLDGKVLTKPAKHHYKFPGMAVKRGKVWVSQHLALKGADRVAV